MTFRPHAGSFAAIALICAALFSPACQSKKTKEEAPLLARFYLELKPGEPGVSVDLPQSGLTIGVQRKPVLVEYDILNAEVAQVELGRCLLVQLTPAAANDLYRLTVNSLGRRLVLLLNDQPVGARRIDEAIADGNLLLFLEVPDVDLPQVVRRLKATAGELARSSRKKK
jgi:hypothetical protein